MCLYPRIIINKKYTINKKNGGKIPPLKDERIKYVPIPCGKCIECLKKKGREWQIRMSEEIKTDNTGKFVTLTFSEKELNKLTKIAIEKNKEIITKNPILENTIAKIAIRRFLERWRKKYKKSVKHWLVTELGQNNTERIHLHGIIFTTETTETIQEIWKYGQIWIGEYVNQKTINYIIKYISKIDKKHKGYVPKILTSAGIGKNYINGENWKLNKYNKNGTKETYIFKNGTKSILPTYYKNKIYTEDEKEKLWIEKLDKNIRWIYGEKIDISEGEEEYYKTLKYYQDKNKRLGYGDNTKEWSIEEYTRQRKALKKKIKEKN